MTFLSSSHDAYFAWGKRLLVPHSGMVKPPAHYGELGDWNAHRMACPVGKSSVIVPSKYTTNLDRRF
jgi:hypothetical protein